MGKEVVLLNGAIVQPEAEIKVKSNELNWFYAEVLPRPDSGKISFEQTYDKENDFFTIKNISKEPQIISLSLKWK